MLRTARLRFASTQLSRVPGTHLRLDDEAGARVTKHPARPVTHIWPQRVTNVGISETRNLFRIQTTPQRIQFRYCCTQIHFM